MHKKESKDLFAAAATPGTSQDSESDISDLEEADYLSYEGRYRALLYCPSFSSALKGNEV
jgi:hypothetical protein